MERPTPVSPEDQFIKIIYASMISCSNNWSANTEAYPRAVRNLESYLMPYIDEEYLKAIKEIDMKKKIEGNVINQSQNSENEYYFKINRELNKLIQRSGFTPPVVMDGVITEDDTNDISGKD